MCEPDFVEGSQLRISGLRHPCVSAEFRLTPTAGFIPNDVNLQRPILLSGPNMGGKSTLIRSVGIAVIMAQVGSFVPCTWMQLAPFDRIFTRLGG